MKRTIWTAILTMCLAPATLSAQADFTFTVPVEVNALHPSIDRAEVRCETRHRNGRRVGFGTVEIPINADGNYSGQLVVEVSANNSDGLVAGDAGLYTCKLGMQVGRTTYYESGLATGPEEIRPKAATPLTASVSGPID